MTIGEEAKRIRGNEKQESFAARVGISRTTLTAIETGKYGYGVDALLQVIAAGKASPVGALLSRDLPHVDARHAELHARLQELLDAEGPWPMAAEVNVDAVWSLYRAKMKLRVS